MFDNGSFLRRRKRFKRQPLPPPHPHTHPHPELLLRGGAAAAGDPGAFLPGFAAYGAYGYGYGLALPAYGAPPPGPALHPHPHPHAFAFAAAAAPCQLSVPLPCRGASTRTSDGLGVFAERSLAPALRLLRSAGSGPGPLGPASLPGRGAWLRQSLLPRVPEPLPQQAPHSCAQASRRTRVEGAPGPGRGLPSL